MLSQGSKRCRGPKQKDIQSDVFFVCLEIDSNQSPCVSTAASAVNCIIAEALAVRDEARRGWRSGQNLPALQAVSKFWAPQELCMKYMLPTFDSVYQH